MLPSLLRKANLLPLAFAVAVSQGFGKAPDIESAITTNGTIVLQVARMEEEEDSLLGVQEFSLMVSEDLVNWEEISRSRLIEDLEVVDFDSKGRAARFYRVVGLSVDESIRVFAEEMAAELSLLSEYASGILIDGVSLAEYEEMQALVAETRADILALLESGAVVPESLLLRYQESIGRIDQLLAKNPLFLSYEGVDYEIDVSQAMKVLGDEYKRLGLVALNDYERLPGVDASDLEGHESLKDYLDTRRVGLEAKLPVFETLSPYGHFTLTHALVLKHMDILSESNIDHDDDGLREINYTLYSRLINGTERVLRSGKAIAEAYRGENSLSLSALEVRPLSNESLGTLLTEVDAFLSDLDAALIANVEDLAYEQVFEKAMLREARGIYGEEEAVFLESLRETIKKPSYSMELIAAYAGSFPSEPASTRELVEVFDEVVQWRGSLQESIKGFLDSLEISNGWRARVESFLLAKLNGYYEENVRLMGIYETVFNKLRKAVEDNDVLLELDGGQSVRLSSSDGLWKAFPSGIDSLLRIAGIAAVLDEEVLRGFVDRTEWNDLLRFRLEPGSSVSDSGLSVFGLRIQLMQALVSAYASEVLAGGELDSAVLAKLVLFDDKIAEYLASAEETVEVGIAKLESFSFADSGSLSPDEYLALLEAIEEVTNAVNESIVGGEAELDYIRQGYFAYFVEARYKQYLEKLYELFGLNMSNLWSQKIRISLGGSEVEINAKWLRTVVANAAQRVGVINNESNRVSRRQLARFSGVSEEDALALVRTTDWVETLRIRGMRRESSAVPYSYSRPGLDGAPQDLETYFVFIPKLLESYGSAALGDNGFVLEEAVENALLDGQDVKVEHGATVLGKCKSIMGQVSGPALTAVVALDQSEWAKREEAEAVYVKAMRDFVEMCRPYRNPLSPAELRKLRSALYGISYYLDLSDVYDALRNGRRSDVVRLSFENGDVWEVELDVLSSVARTYYEEEPSYRYYSGLKESDYLGSLALNPGWALSDSSILGEEELYSDNIDSEKLLIAVLRRAHDNPNSVPALYRDAIEKDGEVVFEVYRRFVNGVDLMHFTEMEAARVKIEPVIARLKAALVAPLTIEKIESAYGDLAELRSDLENQLLELSWRQESRDVLELEEGVTREYQRAFGVLLDSMRSYPLAVELNETYITIPYEAISSQLLGELRKRFPGESISAHHFASLYGISVEDLRMYDKLETFFGSQIVALPRNSSYVEVVSKLSDIGMRQLVSDLVKRHAAVVFDPESGTIDIDSLVALVSDEAIGLARAIDLADSHFDEAEEKLEAIGTSGSLEDLEGVTTLLRTARRTVLSQLVDDVTALSEESLGQVQERIDARYERLKEMVAAFVFDSELTIELIDGGEVVLRIADFEADLASEIEVLAAKYEGHVPSTVAPQVWGGPYIGLWFGRGYEPSIETYDTPTRLGFHLLVARLVRVYGSTVVEDGEFELSAFLRELERSDEGRAHALIEALNLVESEKWEALLPVEAGPISLESARRLSDRFDESYGAFYALYDRLTREISDSSVRVEIDLKMNDLWKGYVEDFESILVGRDIWLEVGGRTVLVEGSLVIDVLDVVYAEGASTLLDAYSVGGESDWQYRSKKTLAQSYFYPYYGYRSGMPSGAIAAGGESSRYAFTLGALKSLPGISSWDLQGLEVVSEDHVTLIVRSAKELMTGLLNLRAVSPGSGVEVVGSTALYAGDGRLGIGVVDGWREPWYPSYPYEVSRYSELSWREKQLHVVMRLILDFAEEVLTESGEIDIEALVALIRAEEDD